MHSHRQRTDLPDFITFIVVHNTLSAMDSPAVLPDNTIAKRAHYSPPWADVSIIGIAGSSGSGKSSISDAIVKKLNLPWVVILSIVSKTAVTPSDEDNSICLHHSLRKDSFYKSLDAESSRKAFLNEYDFDSPEACINQDWPHVHI